MKIQEILEHLEIEIEIAPAKERALLERTSDLIKAQVGQISALKRSIKERDDLFSQFAAGWLRQKDLEESATALGVLNQL